MVPSDVPTGETLTFVEANLPRSPARLLEVGCGHGALALQLQARGHEVVAVDRSEKAVARARDRGVRRRRADWPDFDDLAAFDAVLFTRSLHHIGPLSPAARRARELLKPRGRVLVETSRATKSSHSPPSGSIKCSRFSTEPDSSAGNRIRSWRRCAATEIRSPPGKRPTIRTCTQP